VVWAVIGVVGALLLNVLASEVYSWLPRIARELIRFHVSRLPASIQERMSEEWEALLLDTPGHAAKFVVAADLFRAVPRLRHACAYPGAPFKPMFDGFTRAFDVSLSAIGLFLALPLLAIIAAAIKFESRGPVCIGTKVLGLHKREFYRYAFRIYKEDIDRETGRIVSSFTRSGYLMSRVGLDVLPNLLNILRGHMSFVGPTPVLPGMMVPPVWTGKSLPLPPVPAAIFSVRPGLTGREQLSQQTFQISSPEDFMRWWENRMAVNVEHVMHRGFREHAKIIWTSLRVTLFPPSDICRL
jgi:lipopolysaccharide/colanic/teichoic acid biosynthesis glycosyltransferase